MTYLCPPMSTHVRRPAGHVRPSSPPIRGTDGHPERTDNEDNLRLHPVPSTIRHGLLDTIGDCRDALLALQLDADPHAAAVLLGRAARRANRLARIADRRRRAMSAVARLWCDSYIESSNYTGWSPTEWGAHVA